MLLRRTGSILFLSFAFGPANSFTLVPLEPLGLFFDLAHESIPFFASGRLLI